jgi:glycosyltransferase involved in cell wall biosynthesis
VRLFPVDRPRFWKRSTALHAALMAQVPSYDVVHIHSLYLFHNWAAASACQRAGIPYIVRPHGLLDPYIRRRHRARKLVMERAFQNQALRQAAAIHYTAELEREISTPYACGAPPVVIPLGVDIADASAPRTTLQTKYPQLAGKTVALFLSRIHRKKGLDLLIPALAKARQAHPDLHLVLAGPDDGVLGEVEKLIARHELNAHVTITGMLQGADKTAAFAGADFFVLPSYSENFAIAAVEAMAHGLPVIISDQVNIHPDVTAAGAGIVIPCAIDPLAQALATLAGSAERKAIGTRARALADSKYSWAAIGRALETLYASIARPTQTRISA